MWGLLLMFRKIYTLFLLGCYMVTTTSLLRQNTEPNKCTYPAFGPRFLLHTVASAAKEKGQLSKDAQSSQLSLYDVWTLYTPTFN